MPRSLKIVVISITVIFGLILSSMLIVPWQIKKQGSSWIAENTNRTLTIEKAFFNPFTLTVELNGASLSEQNSDKPFVSFNRLILSGSVESILKKAVILDQVELDQPYVNLELLGKQEFNFSDFTRLGGDQPADPEAKPLHFSLNNIIITGGNIDFTDQTSEKRSRHQIRKLELQVPFIGNIPYMIDNYVQPALSMLLNGSAIHAEGKLKPFHNSLETSLYLTLKDVDLAFYAFHSPVPLPIDVKQGHLDAEVDLSYRISKSEQPRLLLGGELTLSDLDLRELDDREILKLPITTLDIDWINLLTLDFNLADLDIKDPQFYIDRDNNGQWSFERILAHLPAKPPTEEATEDTSADSTPPPFLLKKLTLSNGQIHYLDDFVPDGFKEDINHINLSATNLSTHFDEKTDMTLQLQTDRNFTVEMTGQLGITPLTTDIVVNADNLPIEPYYPYLQPFLTSSPQGTISLGSQVLYTEDGNVQAEKAHLTIEKMLLPFTDSDYFSLASFTIDASSFDLKKQQIHLGSIILDQGEAIVAQLADGTFSPLKLLRERSEAQDTEESAELEETPQPWDIKVASFDLKHLKLQFTDTKKTKQRHVKVADFTFHMENLSYPKAENSPFSLAMKIGKQGKIGATGNFIHTPLQASVKTKISSFPLFDFNDFIPENIIVSLKDGKLDSTLTTQIKQQGEQLTGSFSGQISVSRFNLRDPFGDKALLTWDKLHVKGIDGKISPFALHIKDVNLNNYLANIQIDPQGRVNLNSITNQQSDEDKTPEQPQKPIESSEDKTTSASASADIRIDTVTLDDGTVSFTDRHLLKTFSTTMYKLGGKITGLASTEEMQADVNLSGQLENHSPLTISGKLNPLSKELFADITLSFKDIDMTPLTPYSGTYLGYTIDKGKLYLDLNYHIEHQIVKATNKVMIDQFTFGESVDSDQATSLPVSLAIALLKDSSDEIHLDIPVSGDINDPDFSVAGVIFTVLKNLLVKAATSPFSLLGSMFGGDEDFTGIAFASGLATIDEEGQKKLVTLAEMLAERPSLTLEISGFADKENDPDGYRQEQLRQMLIDVKWRQLQESGQLQESKDKIVISNDEYPELLLTVYKEAEFSRPRNFVGMLKKLPEAEMKKMLLEHIEVGEEQLEMLAKQRAMNVRDILAANNETIKHRLFLKKVDIYQAAEKGPASRVEFNISSK